MTGPDGEVLARLSAALDRDSPPPLVVESAKALFGLRAVDAELAELTADSLERPGAVRGPSEVRLLEFQTAHLLIDVEVTVDGNRRRLLGQAPSEAGRLAVDTPASTTTAAVDAAGFFLADDLPAGPVRLRFSSATGPVATPWTRI